MNTQITPVMKQAHHTVHVATNGQGLYEFTDDVQRWVGGLEMPTGLLTAFCRHTSASLVIQENADPDVRHDLDTFFSRLVSDEPGLYRHTCEGPDDMPAHIRSALTGCSVSIPILDNAPVFGAWQGIYLFEHRAHPHHRQVVLHAMG